MTEKDNNFESLKKTKELKIYDYEILLEDNVNIIVNNVLDLNEALESDDFKRVLDIVNEMLILEPYYIEVLEIKWNALKKLWRSEEALDIYTQSLILWNYKIDFLIKIAILCSDLWEHKKWLDLCEKWLKTYPDNLFLLELKTKFDFEEWNYFNSLNWIDKYLQIWNNSHSLLLTKCMNLYKLEFYDEALKMVKLALGVFNTVWEFGCLKGSILYKKWDKKYAKYYYKALNHWNLNFAAYVDIWDILLDDKYYYLSLKAYKKVVSINPWYYRAYYNMWLIYEKLNNKEMALSAFKKSEK